MVRLLSWLMWFTCIALLWTAWNADTSAGFWPLIVATVACLIVGVVADLARSWRSR